MRILGLILLLACGVYAAVVGAMAYYQRRLIYPGAYWSIGRPNVTRPARVEAVTVLTPDGERLHGLWRAPSPGCGVVLSFHGNGALPEPHAERFTDGPWHEGGWGLLTIAYRGYPGSTGSPSEAGLVQDGLAAHAFARQRATDAPILLHGHSLGAAVAVAVAERAEHIGLYLEAPFNSMSHVVHLHYPLIPSRWLLLDTFRSDTRIAGGDRPVMIVAADRDDIVPAKLALKLAAAAGARARFETVPGDHMSLLSGRDAEAERYFRQASGRSCAETTAQP